MSTKVFVSGATGFIARQTIKLLLSRGYKAVSYTHLDVYKRQAQNLKMLLCPTSETGVYGRILAR